jgi:hypothetical protein
MRARGADVHTALRFPWASLGSDAGAAVIMAARTQPASRIRAPTGTSRA